MSESWTDGGACLFEPWLNNSTLCREVIPTSGLRVYRPRQACLLSEDLALKSRNASQITDEDWLCVENYLRKQWSTDQIALEVTMSHETIYRKIYADKEISGDLYR